MSTFKLPLPTLVIPQFDGPPYRTAWDSAHPGAGTSAQQPLAHLSPATRFSSHQQQLPPSPSYFPQQFTHQQLVGGLPMATSFSSQSNSSFASDFAPPQMHSPALSPMPAMGSPYLPGQSVAGYSPTQTFHPPFATGAWAGAHHRGSPSLGGDQFHHLTPLPHGRPPSPEHFRRNKHNLSTPNSARGISPTPSATSPVMPEKKRPKVKVNFPREAKRRLKKGSAEEVDNDHGNEKVPSIIGRFPLSPYHQSLVLDVIKFDLPWDELKLPERCETRDVHEDEVRRAGLPDMIDVFLPGQEGWDELRELHAPKAPTLPVVESPLSIGFGFEFPRMSPGKHGRTGSLSAFSTSILKAVEARKTHAVTQSLSLGPVGGPLSRAFTMPNWSKLAAAASSTMSSFVDEAAEELEVAWRPPPPTKKAILSKPPSPFPTTPTEQTGSKASLSWKQSAKMSLNELSRGFGMLAEESEGVGEGEDGAEERKSVTSKSNSVGSVATGIATESEEEMSEAVPMVTAPASSLDLPAQIYSVASERVNAFRLALENLPPLPPSEPEDFIEGESDGDADIESAADSVHSHEEDDDGGDATSNAAPTPLSFVSANNHSNHVHNKSDSAEQTLTIPSPKPTPFLNLPQFSPGLSTGFTPSPSPSPVASLFSAFPPPPGQGRGENSIARGVVMRDFSCQTDPVVVIGRGVTRVKRPVKVKKWADGWWGVEIEQADDGWWHAQEVDVVV